MKLFMVAVLSVLTAGCAQFSSLFEKYDHEKSSNKAAWRVENLVNFVNKNEGKSKTLTLRFAQEKQCGLNGRLAAFRNHNIAGESLNDYYTELNKHFPVRKTEFYMLGVEMSSRYWKHVAIVGDGSTLVEMLVRGTSIYPAPKCGDGYLNHSYKTTIIVRPFDKNSAVLKKNLEADLDPEMFAKTEKWLERRKINGNKIYKKELAKHNDEQARHSAARSQKKRERDLQAQQAQAKWYQETMKKYSTPIKTTPSFSTSSPSVSSSSNSSRSTNSSSSSKVSETSIRLSTPKKREAAPIAQYFLTPVSPAYTRNDFPECKRITAPLDLLNSLSHKYLSECINKFPSHDGCHAQAYAKASQEWNTHKKVIEALSYKCKAPVKIDNNGGNSVDK